MEPRAARDDCAVDEVYGVRHRHPKPLPYDLKVSTISLNLLQPSSQAIIFMSIFRTLHICCRKHHTRPFRLGRIPKARSSVLFLLSSSSTFLSSSNSLLKSVNAIPIFSLTTSRATGPTVLSTSKTLSYRHALSLFAENRRNRSRIHLLMYDQSIHKQQFMEPVLTVYSVALTPCVTRIQHPDTSCSS